ncbi:hypothetical protein Ade02nite_08180 [Paractinoplanes deccanensis]|uniref:Holin n=1 Tax=Paractinoplanes deccanensis TaxID=113561 RepID=A0ABQ3XWR2_9ACTN|nr:hypothetical protein [Actinoplanes deccanensis]GID72177.1 hypothetical protein Ade02nite_08180 [Actinoplanes deccanensis]
MQRRRPTENRVQRATVAALFAATNAFSEAFKIVAGFDQSPDVSQIWSLIAVTVVAAALGWVAAPRLNTHLLKKVNEVSLRRY